MKVGFSIDMHDSDGDVWKECILLHIGDGSTILKLEDRDELFTFIANLDRCLEEIDKEYPEKGQV